MSVSEHIKPSLLYRRATDPKDADFHRRRSFEEREVIVKANGNGGSYAKWVNGVVGAGIIALLSVLAMRDRQSIDQTMIHLNGRVQSTEQRVTRVETEIVRIDTKQERVLTDLAELRKALDKNSDKLDRVWMELRRR